MISFKGNSTSLEEIDDASQSERALGTHGDILTEQAKFCMKATEAEVPPRENTSSLKNW